jgi:hypothetical protein
VAREQLRGSTTISGPLPIVPGRQNLRVSDRRPAQLAHAQTVEQTFHSFPAPVYQTIPFERQRASIQAATRAWYAPPQGIPQMRPDEHVQGAPAAVYHAPKTHVDEIHHAPPHPRKSAGKDRHDERSAH